MLAGLPSATDSDGPASAIAASIVIAIVVMFPSLPAESYPNNAIRRSSRSPECDAPLEGSAAALEYARNGAWRQGRSDWLILHSFKYLIFYCNTDISVE